MNSNEDEIKLMNLTLLCTDYCLATQCTGYLCMYFCVERSNCVSFYRLLM